MEIFAAVFLPVVFHHVVVDVVVRVVVVDVVVAAVVLVGIVEAIRCRHRHRRVWTIVGCSPLTHPQSW